MIVEYGMSERLGARKFGTGDGEPFLGREMSHARDYSEEIASAIDDEVRRLIESSHDEAWEILVQYRDVLDHLVLQLLEHETLSRDQVLEIFAPVHKRPTRGSYTGYGKRLPVREAAGADAEGAGADRRDRREHDPVAGQRAGVERGGPAGRAAAARSAGFGAPLGGGNPLGGGSPLGGGNPLGGRRSARSGRRSAGQGWNGHDSQSR